MGRAAAARHAARVRCARMTTGSAITAIATAAGTSSSTTASSWGFSADVQLLQLEFGCVAGPTVDIGLSSSFASVAGRLTTLMSQAACRLYVQTNPSWTLESIYSSRHSYILNDPSCMQGARVCASCQT
eukprot:362740-Chlamydomonas_euryale.AAC.3